jgi:hypothetical protein
VDHLDEGLPRVEDAMRATSTLAIAIIAILSTLQPLTAQQTTTSEMQKNTQNKEIGTEMNTNMIDYSCQNENKEVCSIKCANNSQELFEITRVERVQGSINLNSTILLATLDDTTTVTYIASGNFGCALTELR